MKLDTSSTIIRGGLFAIDTPLLRLSLFFKPGMNFGTTVFAKEWMALLELRMDISGN